jgi:mRNA interferase MazF
MGRRGDHSHDRGRALVSSTPLQGEIWWAEADDKRRPVLVVTRNEAVPVLTWILVAPVTRTVRGIPTEVALGPSHGLADECAATFDNLQPVRRSFLTERVGALAVDERTQICRALSALADC